MNRGRRLSTSFAAALLVTGLIGSVIAMPAYAYDGNTQRSMTINKTNYSTHQYFNLKCANHKWTTRFLVKWTRLSSKKARLESITIYAGDHRYNSLVIRTPSFYGHTTSKKNAVYVGSNKSKTVWYKKTFSTKGNSKWLGQFRPTVSTWANAGGCIPITTLTMEFRL